MNRYLIAHYTQKDNDDIRVLLMDSGSGITMLSEEAIRYETKYAAACIHGEKLKGAEGLALYFLNDYAFVELDAENAMIAMSKYV